MAANPKTQLVKMGLGTVSVVAIVGVTGWVWQADQASAAGAGTAAHALEESAPFAQAQGPAVGTTQDAPAAKTEGTDSSQSTFESAQQPVQPSTTTRRQRGGTFVAPSTSSGTQQMQPRTRTKHS